MARRSRLDQLRPAGHEHVAQPRPVVVVLVDHERRLATRHDVAHAAQRVVARPLGLLVQRRVEARPVEGVADGHDMRRPALVGGRQPPRALGLHEGDLWVSQSISFTHHDPLLAARAWTGDGGSCSMTLVV